MSGVNENVPEDIREYIDAMDAWSLAAAEWLGLDPGAVIRLEVEEEPHVTAVGEYDTIVAGWAAVAQLTPSLGAVYQTGARSDGDIITFGGRVHLDYDDSKRFRDEMGPKPTHWSETLPNTWTPTQTATAPEQDKENA